MMILGAGFIPPHSLVAAIDNTRYRLFYLSTDGDSTAIGLQLKQFLTDDSYLLPVVLVNRATTLVLHSQLLRRYARRVYAVLICDSAAELLAHSIPLLDGVGTETGWWRKPGAVAGMVEARLAEHRNTLRLSRLRRQAAAAPQRKKLRGQLAKLVAAVTAAVPGQKRATRLLRSLLGRLVGTVAAAEYRAAVLELRTKYRSLAGVLEELAHYQRSPTGVALHRVFYRMQLGDDFRELQIKHKQLSLDDWLAIGEYWPSTEKHVLKARPPR